MTSREHLLEILRTPEVMAEVSVDDVPGLLGEVEQLRAQLWSRLLRAQTPRREAVQAPDRLLGLRDAAERLGVSVQWVRRHSRQLPFSVRISRKAVRFSERGLGLWIERHRGRG